MPPRGLPKGAGSRASRVGAHPAVRAAKRLWPVALEAKRRWDKLTPEQQERYRRMAGDYARRGQQTLGRRPRRRKP
jgi:hypothetical protein